MRITGGRYSLERSHKSSAHPINPVYRTRSCCNAGFSRNNFRCLLSLTVQALNDLLVCADGGYGLVVLAVLALVLSTVGIDALTHH